MVLSEAARLSVPALTNWERSGLHLFLDPEAPHWISTDHRGAALLRALSQGLSLGEVAAQYARQQQLSQTQAWLHTHDFTQALIRSGLVLSKPAPAVEYAGRSAYAAPQHLRELWIHTNNVCNLSCSHCLVDSAPWVKDTGLSTQRLMALLDEAARLGVDRFYFTGGEPLIRPDIFELMQYVTEAKGAELIVLTNAILVNGERAREIRKLNRKKIRFQVSVDGATPQTNDPIRGKGSFETTLAGLKQQNSL